MSKDTIGSIYKADSMFYTADMPWHGAGKKVDGALTAEEAIVQAGMDWEVASVPLYVQNQGGKKGFQKVDNKRAIIRTTDAKVLGTLGPGYTPIQNRDAFGFFDSLLADKSAKYVAAGSMMGGRRVWLLAEVNGGNGSVNIGGDEVKKMLMLMNGHDGKLAVKMFFLPFRPPCLNVLSTVDSRVNAADRFYSRHSGDVMGRLEKAREILGITVSYYEDFAEQARRMAAVQLPAAEMPKLLTAAFGTTKAMAAKDVVNFDEMDKRRQEQYARVTALFEGEGRGLAEKNIKGTKWAAYNAVTEYIDHCKEYGGANPGELRWQNAVSSRGMRVKQRAWDYLQKGK